MAANLTLAQAFIKLRLEGESQVVAAVKAVNTQVSNAIKPMASLFEPAKESVLAFVKAASPQAFNTFNGSMQILSASIGRAFIPQIVEASKWIQDFAKWIRELDPETKKQIASWVGYGIVIAGAAAAFLKLNEVLKVLAANPWVLALTAGLVVLKKILDMLDSLQAKMNRSIETMQRMAKGKFTKEEYDESEASKIEQTKDDPIVKRMNAQLMKNKLQAEARMLSQEAADYSDTGNNAAEDLVKSKMGMPNKTDDYHKAIESKMKDIGMLEDLVNRIDNKKGGPKFTADPSGKGKGDFAVASPNSGINGSSGSITSLENAFSQTAQAALAADEIQRQLLKLAMEGNQDFQKQAADVNRMANAIERQQMP